MFYQIFLSPQVKQSTIISNEHGIYELPQELPNELKLRKDLRKLGKIRKISKAHRIKPSAQSSLQNKTLLTLVQNCWKIEIKTFPHFATSHEN